jgi:2-oxoglutarate ferredoxin oxidoreductase subunit alpha
MIYVGVVADLLHIEQEEIEKSIHRQFEGKQKVIDLNLNAVKTGRQWSSKNLKKNDPFFVERMNETTEKIIIDGNAAAAIGAMFAGATVMTWYPITPSSSLCETMTDYLNQYRTDKETGKATYAVIQAEDELAAIGIAVGAGWAGARSMTSTSGPGISLMAELTGYAYFTEIPVVIFDVQRVGPSTGMPTRTAQGDIISAHFLSHGDTSHILLLPGSVAECYEMAMDAFELAEQFQTPIFVMSDLDLGMNNWMSDPFKYPDKPISRGKVLSAEQLDKLGKFERYRDVDGDGIPYRTIPGTKHSLAAYFTRGSGHNEKAGYTEKPHDYENLMLRFKRKYETAKNFVPKPILIKAEKAKTDVGVIAYGSSDLAVKESLDQLKAEGVTANYLRIRALPFTAEVTDFIAAHKRIYVVEQNCDGQMSQLLRMEYPQFAASFISVLHFNGLPIDARSVSDEIIKLES